ncbi:hypothetical protein GCM10009665_63680 [Kitasatospora nipponensis]|uniref:Type VII secretion system (Wss) protein ESAT-6 n=1 Tax=Kitasatospora nipponensis TaxID=258049 RepID=A0ABN1WWI2_9ACTN
MNATALPDGGGSGWIGNLFTTARNVTLMAGQVSNDIKLGKLSAQNVSVEMDTLTGFKKQVDQILTDLYGSPADSSTLANQTLEPSHVGVGFAESGELIDGYNVVHTNLVTLSQTLSDQIEAMGIALNVSINGYQNVDESQRQSLWRIHNQTDAQFQSGVNPSGIVTRPATDATVTPPAPGTPGTTTTAPVTKGGGVG